MTNSVRSPGRGGTHPYSRARALAQVAGSLASAGQHDQAEAVARSIADRYWQAGALVQVAGSLASAGQHD